MNRFSQYLEHIRLHYGDFRYLSDKNSLGIIDKLDRIAFGWIENEAWFACAFIDTSLSRDTCFFGYLEILSDFDRLFLEIQNFARKNNCKRILWPVNLSFWNTYRFSDTPFEKTLLWEYETSEKNHDLLLKSGFRIYEEYLTVYRNSTNPFTHYTLDESLTLESISGPTWLHTIYALSREIFHTIPPIGYEEFLVYMDAYREIYGENSTIFLLKYQGKEIWFLSSLSTDTYFVIKTLWILPEYRKKWYGNMLLDHAFQCYFQKNVFESYGLYMRMWGDVMHMSSGGGELYRKYFTYIYSL